MKKTSVLIVFTIYFFLPKTPASTGTAKENTSEIINGVPPSKEVLKIFLKTGRQMLIPSTTAEIITENSKNGFDRKSTVKRFFSSDLHSKTCIS